MTREPRERLSEALIRKLESAIASLEKASLAEFIELYRHPRRLLFINFLAGVTRGFGIAVGFTAVGAVFLFILGRLAALNLPIIGQFIADIARIVQMQLQLR